MGIFKTSTVATSSPRVSSFLVTQSSYGSPIKLIFGTSIVAPVMLDYIDFTAIAHTTTTSSGGKGGSITSSSTSYTYTVAVLLGLGEGTLTGTGSIWDGNTTTDAGSLGLTFFNGAIGGSGHYAYNTYSINEVFECNKTYTITLSDACSVSSVTYGGLNIPYTFSNSVLTFKTGGPGVYYTNYDTLTITYQTRTYVADTAGQQPWGYMVTNHSDRALSYSGTSYLAGVIDLGDSSSLPNYNIEVYGLCQSQQGTPTTTKVQQFAYEKTIEISNFSGNNYVEEYNGSGWIALDTRYYSVDQKKDSYGNYISGVYVYTFNFDDRTDGYDRADPFYLRIHYTAITASVSYAKQTLTLLILLIPF